MSTRRHHSEERSESAAASVTSVSIHANTLPDVGQVKIVPASTGYKAVFNTGGPLGVVEAYGKTEVDAHDKALRLAAELFIGYERRMRAKDEEFDDYLPETDDELEMSAAAYDRAVTSGRMM